MESGHPAPSTRKASFAPLDKASADGYRTRPGSGPAERGDR